MSCLPREICTGRGRGTEEEIEIEIEIETSHDLAIVTVDQAQQKRLQLSLPSRQPRTRALTRIGDLLASWQRRQQPPLLVLGTARALATAS